VDPRAAFLRGVTSTLADSHLPRRGGGGHIKARDEARAFSSRHAHFRGSAPGAGRDGQCLRRPRRDAAHRRPLGSLPVPRAPLRCCASPAILHACAGASRASGLHSTRHHAPMPPGPARSAKARSPPLRAGPSGARCARALRLAGTTHANTYQAESCCPRRCPLLQCDSSACDFAGCGVQQGPHVRALPGVVGGQHGPDGPPLLLVRSHLVHREVRDRAPGHPQRHHHGPEAWPEARSDR